MMTFDNFSFSSALTFPRGNICPSNGGRSSSLQKAGKVYKNWSVKKYRAKNIFAFRRVSRCSTLTGTTYYQLLCARFPFWRALESSYKSLKIWPTMNLLQLLLHCVRLQELHLQLVDTLDDLLWEQVDQRHWSILDKYLHKIFIRLDHEVEDWGTTQLL